MRGTISNCELIVTDDTSDPQRPGADITLDWTNAAGASDPPTAAVPTRWPQSRARPWC